METREIYTQRLDETIAQLLSLYQNMVDPETEVSEGWTAKDVLGHITFWHESFARNVSDIVNGIKPTPLKGKLSDLNQRGVAEMSGYPLETVLERLETAHRVIQENILDPRLVLIPYRKGSRDYTPEEHLSIVNDHLQGHLKVIKKFV